MNKRFLTKLIFASIAVFAVTSFTTYLITTTILSLSKENHQTLSSQLL